MTPRSLVAPIRVLVVDDSVVVRRVVARALEAEPGLELAAAVPNGQVAIDRLDAAHPDVVVLDLDMPVMDGFQTIAALRERNPDLPVVVFSHLTREGAVATLEALELGATGFALKPRADGIGLAEEHVRTELFPLLTAVSSRPSAASHEVCALRSTISSASRQTTRVSAVVIGVSTGGPNALAEIVPALPESLGVPVFVVQHMPPVFTRTLAERLDRAAALRVVEACDGDEVDAGSVYIAPGGRHMAVTGPVRWGRPPSVRLNDDPPENSCRPSVDVLFRSAVETYGPGVLAVVLTGMGRDGLRGASVVCDAGGTVIVQDAATCVVSSMPDAVAAAGLADAVVPLDGISSEITRRVRTAP